jgi:ankyrin repeat protein
LLNIFLLNIPLIITFFTHVDLYAKVEVLSRAIHIAAVSNADLLYLALTHLPRLNGFFEPINKPIITLQDHAALYCASKSADPELSATLLSRVKLTKEQVEAKTTPLHGAIYSCNLMDVKKIIEQSAHDPKAEKQLNQHYIGFSGEQTSLSPLELSIELDQKDIALTLIDTKGVVLDSTQSKHKSPLMRAIAHNQEEVVAALLHKKVKLTSMHKTDSPWSLAINSRNPLFSVMLLEAGANINKKIKGFTLLQYILSNWRVVKKKETLKALLFHRPPLDITNADGQTAETITMDAPHILENARTALKQDSEKARLIVRGLRSLGFPTNVIANICYKVIAPSYMTLAKMTELVERICGYTDYRKDKGNLINFQYQKTIVQKKKAPTKRKMPPKEGSVKRRKKNVMPDEAISVAPTLESMVIDNSDFPTEKDIRIAEDINELFDMYLSEPSHSSSEEDGPIDVSMFFSDSFNDAAPDTIFRSTQNTTPPSVSLEPKEEDLETSMVIDSKPKYKDSPFH